VTNFTRGHEYLVIPSC